MLCPGLAESGRRKCMWLGHMGEKGQIRGVEAVPWTDKDSASLTPGGAVSDKAWLSLFVVAQIAMIAFVLAWPHTIWLPFLCDTVMAALTFSFAADHLRRAKAEVRLNWIMLLAAMALLFIGRLLQFW